MLKQSFKDQKEFESYLTEQKNRQEGGYLTRSERETLKKMQEKNYKPIFIKEKPELSIVTDINYLRQSCQEITKDDPIKEIIQKLKDTLNYYGGYGITANQIGIQKKISYLKIPKITKDKKLEYNEYIMINAKIIERDNPIRVNGEGCLSLKNIFIDTQRFIFITVEYLNENLKPQIGAMQDLESLVCQHEHSHQCGRTILDDKWIDINKRK